VSGDLLVNEIFGPVWQGEGRQAGQRCFFIRTATCNLECTWCDTPQTWVYNERKATKHSRIDVPFNVRTESTRMNQYGVMTQLHELNCSPRDLIVISGGEPMLQQHALEPIIQHLWLVGMGGNLAVETAGTIAPEEWWEDGIQWTVSPKLSGSGNDPDKRYNADAIMAFKDRGADFKFVVTGPEDMVEVDHFVIGHDLDRSQVWVMPEGITPEAVMEGAGKLADWASHLGYNLTLRQHILMYGDERKR